MKFTKIMFSMAVLVLSQSVNASSYSVICDYWIGIEQDGNVLGYNPLNEVVETKVQMDSCEDAGSPCISGLNSITDSVSSDLPTFDIKLKVTKQPSLIVHGYGDAQFDSSQMSWYGEVMIESNGGRVASMVLSSKFDVNSTENSVGSEVSIISVRDPGNSNLYLVQCFNAFSI